MKKQFAVYALHTQHYSDGKTDHARVLLGHSYAASAAQAINNVKYRLGMKPVDKYCDGVGYCRNTTYEAVSV